MWLDESENAVVHLETGHADTSVKLSEIGVEDYVISAGDFDLEIRLFRLADVLVKGPVTASVDVPIKAQGDTHGDVKEKSQCGDRRVDGDTGGSYLRQV